MPPKNADSVWLGLSAVLELPMKGPSPGWESPVLADAVCKMRHSEPRLWQSCCDPGAVTAAAQYRKAELKIKGNH